MRVKKRGYIYKKILPLAYDIANATKNVFVEIPPSALEVMLSDERKIYASPHKSMRETIQIPAELDRRKIQVPYSVVAKTLVGWEARWLAEYIGLIFVDTKNITQGTKDMIAKIPPIIRAGHDTHIMPEGTRSRTGLIGGYSAPIFQIAIDLSKEQEIWIEPCNCDYLIINEADKLVSDSKKKYKFWAAHLGRWKTDLDTIYITFGEPIRVRDFNNRKELNIYVKEKTLSLYKISPTSVYSAAMLESGPNPSMNNLKNNISKFIDRLEPHNDKFILFKTTEDVLNKTPLSTHENPKIYELYKNNIAHYLGKN